ncbi:choice-of-anchor D domain-containing protein [Pseudofulvimonas gallinarii]|uniref:ASPM-SPD-2-Hydin domain-containing protein n=1 Tax=Pseudofulvimonas gallinarii TaxID=634155 RepID=A0A4V2UW42_9GAMM|nr:choice-of-anchor D domain-containing protein [Pseudofulvimonas gallinarii]TCS98167.1 ASPM-SPD-2-Hydin domain-containing protein [Pseudofulvimonas gallinarii]
MQANRSRSFRIVRRQRTGLLLAGLLAGATGPALAGSPVVALTPNPFDFGAVTVGQDSPAQAFTLANPTSDPMTLTSVGLGGAAPAQYQLVSTNCAGVLDPGSSCTVNVRFAPSATGSQVALIRVQYTMPPPAPPGGQEITATLFGTGVAAPVAPPRPVPGPGALAVGLLALLGVVTGLRALRRQPG